MMEIELPFSPGDTRLGPALETLRSSGRHALVTERSGQPFVLRASDLAECWNALVDVGRDPEAVQLASVVPRATPAVLPDKMAGLDPKAGLPGSSRVEINKMFRDQDARHTVRAVLGNLARVITASERFAGILLNGQSANTGVLASIVRCKGPPVHYWESSDLLNPKWCNAPHPQPTPIIR